MTKCNADTTNDNNNSSKMQKASGDKQLGVLQLVQHHHMEALQDMSDVAQDAGASQLQLKTSANAKSNQLLESLHPLVTKTNKATSQIRYFKCVHDRLKLDTLVLTPMKPTKRTLLQHLANQSQ
jgi:DNA-binding phage protein